MLGSQFRRVCPGLEQGSPRVGREGLQVAPGRPGVGGTPGGPREGVSPFGITPSALPFERRSVGSGCLHRGFSLSISPQDRIVSHISKTSKMAFQLLVFIDSLNFRKDRSGSFSLIMKTRGQ